MKLKYHLLLSFLSIFFLKILLTTEFGMPNVFAQNPPEKAPYGALTEQEQRVIDHKGTERAFTGKYTDFFKIGIYACRKCGAPLYRSDDKFTSDCGWPAFDDELPGAIKRATDADGHRIEIMCNKCGGHLGHVFSGEQRTEKDIRHCVNSISMVFEPQTTGRLQRAVFAGGCFWGVEELMRHQKGVVSAISGYTGGSVDYPTYQQICTGQTGHAEAVEIIYDTQSTDFETLCKYFMEIHDPTQKDRQGPDIGTQYRSAIFCFDDAQKRTARKLLAILTNKGYNVQTKLISFRRFWPAEEKHQDYYEKKGTAPYCHTWQKRF